jgi:hypothetical protein
VSKDVPDSLYFTALKTIQRLDCSTPRCYANGFCTGYLRRHPLVGWGVEYDCPDCHQKGIRSTRWINDLAERVLAAGQEEQQKLIESFVASRPDTRNPFRAPWP